MNYAIDKQEKYTIFKLDEEKLDTMIAPDLKSEFVKINAEGVINVILSLEGVKYIDSSGLSAILVANRLCENANGKLVLTKVSDHVMKLFKISQLDSVLTILPTVEESVDAIFINEIENDLNSENSDLE